MSDVDTVIREVRLIPGPAAPVDIAVVNGVVVAIGPSLPGSAREEIDGRGLVALPGVVDPHVHFNEPGERTGWEGWDSGSAAAAAGGVTTVAEMPLNACPPTVDVGAFDAKRACAERRSRVDFALWGGVVPGNAGELAGLAARGVVGFKAFMSASGVADFPASDTLTLYEAMAVIAELGLPLAVHAESDELTRGLAERARAQRRLAMADYLRTRPAVAEADAVARVVELAHASGCRLHIVHISTARGVALVCEGRAAGVDVTCEVTAHHLLLDATDAVRLGAVAKCAPPLRPAEEPAALWVALRRREIDFVVSDHSPAPPELKREDDLLSSWGGIAGIQSTLPLLLTETHLDGDAGRLPSGLIGEVLAGAAARRFALPGKGELAPGMDADIALVELDTAHQLQAHELRSRHRLSPYLGRTVTARVRRTLLRGATIQHDGVVVGPPRGRLLTPGDQNPSR